MKVGLGHANHRRRPAVQRDRVADDAVHGLKRGLPQMVADDRDQAGRAARRLVGGEAAPVDDAHAERVEIVRRHDARAHRIAAVLVHHGHAPEIVRGDRRERGGVLGEMRVDAVAGVRFDEAILGHPADRLQAARMHARRRLGQDAVRHREDGRVAADDERHEQDGGGAERGRLRQDPESDANVLNELLERGPDPHGSCPLLDERRAAERHARAALGLGAGQAARDAALGFLGDVKPDLLVQVAVVLGTAEQRRGAGLVAHVLAPPQRVLRCLAEPGYAARAHGRWRATGASSGCAPPAAAAGPPASACRTSRAACSPSGPTRRRSSRGARADAAPGTAIRDRPAARRPSSPRLPRRRHARAADPPGACAESTGRACL